MSDKSLQVVKYYQDYGHILYRKTPYSANGFQGNQAAEYTARCFITNTISTTLFNTKPIQQNPKF